MTRRDYETIAMCFAREAATLCPDYPGALAVERSRDAGRRHALRSVANRIALELAIDNPRFDRDRFMAACNFDR